MKKHKNKWNSFHRVFILNTEHSYEFKSDKRYQTFVQKQNQGKVTFEIYHRDKSGKQKKKSS